jgi:hypothetical protein
MGRERTSEQQPAVRPRTAPTNDDHRAPDIDRAALAAFAIYLTLSIVFFGRTIFGHMSTAYIGAGTDPALMAWFLAWWPHAIANHLNPILTRAIWAPSGLNLASQTSIPLAAALAGPLTLTLGPVVAFNFLCLLSLPLDAWCAFILCRHVTRHYWASLLGGYIFGFSAFLLGQLTGGHLHMLLVFPVPLAVYVVVCRLNGEITERKFTSLLTLLLVAEFLLSIEIFATMTMFGALSLLLAWSSGTPPGARQRLLVALRPIGLSYGIALILISPLLYYLLAFFITHKPFFSPTFYSADLLNFLIPTQTNELGRIALFRSVSQWFFHGWLSESGACFSLPIIVIAAAYANRHRREPSTNLLVIALIVIVVLSLGPGLHIKGHEFPIRLPWLPFIHLPMIDNALPARFSMYAFLILALIVSLWLASAEIKPLTRFTGAAVIIAFNLPNLSSSFWSTAVNTPAFFQGGVYKNYLRRGENVVILPYAAKGNSMFWQAETDMYFNMAEGSGAAWPASFLRWPIAPAFADQMYVPDASRQLKAFLAAHDVRSVIVADQDLAIWQKLLSTIDVKPVSAGGVSLYRSSEISQRVTEAPLLDMRSRFDAQRIATLVQSANKYLTDGGGAGSLSVLRLNELGLIPEDSLIGPPPQLALGTAPDAAQSMPRTPYGPNLITDPHLAYGVWLGESSDGRIGIAEQAWYPAIVPLLQMLQGVTDGIYFPYPNKLAAVASPPREQDGWLLITFTREHLARADELLKESSIQSATRDPAN